MRIRKTNSDERLDLLEQGQNFGWTQDFRELRQDAMLCLDHWLGSEESSDNNMA